MWFLFPLQIGREYNGEVEDPKADIAMKIITLLGNVMNLYLFKCVKFTVRTVFFN